MAPVGAPEKTKELVEHANRYIKGGAPPQDLPNLVNELRIRRKWTILRAVIEKIRNQGSEGEFTDDQLRQLEAFSYLRDTTLSNQARWDGALEKLGALKDDKENPLIKAIAQEQDIEKSREMLRGRSSSYEDLLKYAKKMKNHDAFTYARRLFEQAAAKCTSITDPDYEYLTQQLAICTYKDVDLSLVQRLEKALKILSTLGLETCMNPETLGIAGSIYKQKWEAEKRLSDLRGSAQLYERAHKADMALVVFASQASVGGSAPVAAAAPVVEGFKAGHRFGWPGVNAAFMLDLMGENERANQLRNEIVAYLSAVVQMPEEKFQGNRDYDKWWTHTTLAEAHFGLRQFTEAHEVLEKVRTGSAPWKFKAFVDQLVKLAEFQDSKAQASQILAKFLGEAQTAQNAVRGKLGLALSGGGFRASFYHLGVLAKLAELNVLKHVEVLSCVSGGSIVGALYYLELRRLLQTTPDGQIDYVELVKRVNQHFTSAVQKNIRTRLFWNPWTNLKMILFPRYSRTVRAGELMEKFIYSGAADGEGCQPRWMDEMLIEPMNADLTFQPKNDNWRRIDKVPMLILNATSLNTGNNWQFTASWMGEPPPANEEDFDGKARLRRTYYREAPKECGRVRLGTAVAASACVPGVFEPIVLTDLYRDYTVRLVDGGVFDNQGLSALMDLGCRTLLVSDGCGQTHSDRNPHAGSLAPLWRASDITMQCVRDGQLRHLRVQRRVEMVSRAITVHLKKKLGSNPVDWIKCMDPSPPQASTAFLPYGILRKIQDHLSAVRTDLDCFSDAEAYALMTSGYLMTEECAPEELGGIVDKQALMSGTRKDWPFLKVEDDMCSTAGAGYTRLERVLEVSKYKGLKAFRLFVSPIGLLIAGFVLALAVGLGIYAMPWWKVVLAVLTRYRVWFGIAGLAIVAAKILVDSFACGFRLTILVTTPLRLLSSFSIAVIGWIAAAIQLKLIDRAYLAYGRQDHFGK